MKTEPTDTDCEAARLFVCVDGMRAGWCHTNITVVPPRNRCIWERICYDGAEPDALDTDDPATVGAMLAQVEDAAGEPVNVARHSCHDYLVWACDPPGAYGWTRGAALVAAMRAIKGNPTQ